MNIYLNTGKNQLQLLYGQGIQPSTLTSGQGRLRDIGTLGDYPTSGPAFDTRATIATTERFWFVQTSATSFDMVSADDARKWVSWFWIFD
jgi:hypothetical protein